MFYPGDGIPGDSGWRSDDSQRSEERRMTIERNILLTIQYDGTAYCGWQRQPDVATVQGEVEKVLSKLCAMPVKVEGSGRTDAGVHALGQRATFHGEFSIPTERIAFAGSNLLPPDIRITEAVEVPHGFHARFDATGKKYMYRIVNSSQKDPFRRNYVHFVPDLLDLEAMRQGASAIVGTHDFKCFQAMSQTPKEDTVRTVYSLDLTQWEEEITLEVVGNGFLYNMVRIITGTLLDVGAGKIPAKDVEEMIKSKDRTRAGHTAPPQGLYLAEVYYGEQREDDGQETQLG